MKKSIIYETPDGQKFTTRRQALQHETNLTRRAQITRFLLARTKLKQVSDSVTVEHVIEILCAAAEVEVAAVLAAISAGDFTRESSDNRNATHRLLPSSRKIETTRWSAATGEQCRAVARHFFSYQLEPELGIARNAQ